MGFLRNLFKGKAKRVEPAQPPVSAEGSVTSPEPAAPRPVEKSALSHGGSEASSDPASGVNIWDFDGAQDGAAQETVPTAEGPAVPISEAASSAADVFAPTSDSAPRSRRNKTRIIGFESANNEVVSLFDSGAPDIAAPKAAISAPDRPDAQPASDLPLGWLVVVEGAGRGTSFTLTEAHSNLGRDASQSVALDFDDMEIAAEDHAQVIYQDGGFRLAAGSSEHSVTLNESPVAKTGDLTSGDTIGLGETRLRFVALCGKDFGWEDAESKENSHVASA